MSRPVLLVFAATLLLVGCGSSDDGSQDRGGRRGASNGDPPSVQAVQARFGSLPLEERMSGTVEAQNQVAIYPEIDAPVEAVIAQNGDDMEEGDPLVRLRDDQYQERVRQAEASLRIARADAKSARADLEELRSQLNRTERLADQEFESQQQLESLRAQVEQAEAQVERAEAQVQQAQATLGERKADLRRTVVRAPITGRVGNRNVQGGQRVDPNTQLYTMGNLGSVRITVPVSDRMMGRIEEGQTARITAPSLDDTTIVADVSRVSPFVSSGSYSAEAEIDVANPDGLLRAGMFVQVDVAYAESQRAPLVPFSALYEDPTTGRRGLFVAPTLGTEVPVEMPDSEDSGSEGADTPPPLTQPTPTRFREVEIVAEGAQTAGIRGIEPGDWVITVGQNLLSTSPDERVDARVRPMSWARLMTLQRLQDTDLLQRVLDRQQEMAERRFGNRDTTQADTTASAARGLPNAFDSTRLSGSSLRAPR